MNSLFVVAGKPILKSRSPEIMNAAFRALSIDAAYTRMAPSDAADIVNTARSMGIKGFNVTAPFKEAVIPHLDELDRDAGAIRAVNTVVNESGNLKGYNTDFIGVKDALVRNGVDPRGKYAVVLGASGAGRAAVFALRSSGAWVTVVNRTYERGRGLAAATGSAFLPIGEIDEAVGRADILVSCVPSCERIIKPSSFRKDLAVLDAHYSSETALTTDARAAGARVIDGREWLLFQALPAFRLFTGKDAPEDVMRKALYYVGESPRTNVGLIGFMGAGKSAAGEGVARRLGMTILDTDRAVADRAGFSIPEIFSNYGEDRFRTLEEAEVGRVKNLSGMVISFGGGSVLKETNRDVIRGRCAAFWLWASADVIMDRIGDDGRRPLLEGRGRAADVGAMLRARFPFYARAADCVINTDGCAVEEIIERICNEIGSSL